MMNVFDFALKMELEGEKYYRDMAEKVQYDELKKVLLALADDEHRHYKIINQVKENTVEQIEEVPFLEKVKNVFSANKEHQFIDQLRSEQIDVYRAALVKEKESVELYKKLQADSEKENVKSIFKKLMQEEERHAEQLEHIIDMLNNVNDWVESAEFNHKDIY
jgi:rubrerythrin